MIYIFKEMHVLLKIIIVQNERASDLLFDSKSTIDYLKQTLKKPVIVALKSCNSSGFLSSAG